jgi:hypothetical protein
MGYKQDYNKGNDIRLGSAIAIINNILKKEYDEIMSMELTRDEAIKISYKKSWRFERLIGEYLGERLTIGMDSWKFFWCMLWFDIHKSKIIDDGLRSVSVITGIQLSKNAKEQHENRMLSEVISEYKEKYCNRKGWM